MSLFQYLEKMEILKQVQNYKNFDSLCKVRNDILKEMLKLVQHDRNSEIAI